MNQKLIILIIIGGIILWLGFGNLAFILGGNEMDCSAGAENYYSCSLIGNSYPTSYDGKIDIGIRNPSRNDARMSMMENMNLRTIPNFQRFMQTHSKVGYYITSFEYSPDDHVDWKDEFPSISYYLPRSVIRLFCLFFLI